MSTTKMLNKSDAQIRIYRDGEELALKAARRFARLADQYVVGAGRFTVALSGGSTPRTMLSKAPVPEENIFRVPAELEDHDKAAEEYSATLRNFFLTGPGASKTGTAPLATLPRFDLVLLGMGPDGHTASLFPGTTALSAGEQIAVANYVEKFDSYRITLTAATINNARNVTFVAGGGDKAETLKDVLEGPYQPDLYPSQMIRPRNGSLLWMVDEAAASQLSDQHES